MKTYQTMLFPRHILNEVKEMTIVIEEEKKTKEISIGEGNGSSAIICNFCDYITNQKIYLKAHLES